MSAVEHHPALAYTVDAAQVASVAAEAVAAHPEWVEASAAIRDVLTRTLDHGLPTEDGSPAGLRDAALQTAYEALVRYHLAHAQSGDAARILQAWIESVRLAADEPHTSIYPLQLAAHRLYGLGELAPSAGLADEVQHLIADLHNAHHGPALMRQLSIAEYLVTPRP
jgi:hypothetical protein